MAVHYFWVNKKCNDQIKAMLIILCTVFDVNINAFIFILKSYDMVRKKLFSFFQCYNLSSSISFRKLCMARTSFSNSSTVLKYDTETLTIPFSGSTR